MEPVRVTEPLSYFCPPALMEWKWAIGKREANRVFRDAEKVGTKVDALIKADKLPGPKDSWEVKACFEAFQKWRAVYGPKTITPQYRLYGELLGVKITGEPDLMIDDGLRDLKCTNSIKKQNILQLQVYEYLRRQNGLPPAKDLGLLRLDRRTCSFQVPDPFDYDENLVVVVYGGLLKAYLYYKETDDGTEL
jgi:hypothetical protein